MGKCDIIPRFFNEELALLPITGKLDIIQIFFHEELSLLCIKSKFQFPHLRFAFTEAHCTVHIRRVPHDTLRSKTKLLVHLHETQEQNDKKRNVLEHFTLLIT